jgi:hypothetical protein
VKVVRVMRMMYAFRGAQSRMLLNWRFISLRPKKVFQVQNNDPMSQNRQIAENMAVNSRDGTIESSITPGGEDTGLRHIPSGSRQTTVLTLPTPGM